MKEASTLILGFGILLLSLLFLGTWPALLRLTSTPHAPSLFGYSFRNRDTRFAYLDYAISYAVSSAIPLLFSLSKEAGNPETAVEDTTPDFALILFAVTGGFLLSFGNMSMQWATTIFGAPLTTVVAIQASLTVLLGTSINYLLEPTMTSRPEKLLYGVIVFLAAIGLATRAHLIYGEQQDMSIYEDVHIELGPRKRHSYGSLESCESSRSSTSSVDGEQCMESRKCSIVETSSQVKSDAFSPRLALIFSIFGGCCFGFFSPAFNVAVNDPFGWASAGSARLSVPLANLWFSISFTVASFTGNIPLMYNPPHHFGIPPVTLGEYFRESLVERTMAIFAGMLCGFANLLQFQGGSLVGFATADLVQAYPLVSTVWDICLFGEFKSAKGTVLFYLGAMYVMYSCGILFLISSAAMQPQH